MALKVNGTIVVDNASNVTNVNGYFGNGVADKADAIAAVDNSKLMTPPRVKESIEQNAVLKVGGSAGAAALPGGGDGGRPTPVLGMIRYNSQSRLEYYDGSRWLTLAISGSGLQDPRGWFGHAVRP